MFSVASFSLSVDGAMSVCFTRTTVRLTISRGTYGPSLPEGVFQFFSCGQCPQVAWRRTALNASPEGFRGSCSQTWSGSRLMLPFCSDGYSSALVSIHLPMLLLQVLVPLIRLTDTRFIGAQSEFTRNVARAPFPPGRCGTRPFSTTRPPSQSIS